jgi:CBS domain-containing protein
MSTVESRPSTGSTLGIWPIADLSREDISFAGGKGANLGELARAGLPVPPAFVVGAPAYAAFVDHTGLRARIEARLDGLDIDDPAVLETAAQDVRAMIEAEPIPSEIAEEIRRAYEELIGAETNGPVAVRSSATAEDTEAASFAGMNETFLNTRGPDAVLEAVRRCWSSLFGGRTIFYRAKRGFGQADMDIAVIVQRQIVAARAGVMFTVDPATGAADRLVIEGSFGLGEAVVSGRISPDRYVVDKDSLAVLVREIHPKTEVIEPHPQGGTMLHELSYEAAIQPTLSDAEARSLARLGKKIESHYGSAQDTEWAIDAHSEIWMLQSTAGPARDRARRRRAMRVEDVMTREVITVPPGASLKEAARLLVERHISGLPVVDDQDHVLGILSETDVLRKEAGVLPEFDRSKLEAHVVGEAMTAPALTIDAERPVSHAAKLMVENGVNRLPVVVDGRLVGVVTRADLVRAFVRTDAEIAQEIREDVVVRGLWLDKHSVQVKVDDGEVTLGGRVDSRTDADLLQALVGRVAGVVGVRSRLAWADDDLEC